MVAGTFMLTDSIDKAFDSIFTEVRQGSNAVISGKTAFDLSQDVGSSAPTLDESLLDTVRSLPDVEAAEGGVDGQAQLIGKDGKAIVYGGAPNLGFSIADGASRFNPLTLVEGSWPGTGEVVVDESTADKESFRLGQRIRVQAEGAARTLRISGFVRSARSPRSAAPLSPASTSRPRRGCSASAAELDEIAVAAKPGVSDEDLVGELQATVPPTAQVKTASQQAHDDAAETNSFISFLRGFLLAFGGIALFVGSFVIANSLSITIAQRTREFATVRTIGASRRQILTSVLIEALVVGVLASLVGLAAGVGLAKALFWLFDLVGFTLPNSGLVLTPTAVVLALAAGILVTVVASVRPAFRATRVPPIAAVREGGTLPRSRFASLRTPASILLTLLGFAALSWALFGPDMGTTALLVWMGLGALMIFLGVALLAERLVQPLATLLGWPWAEIGGAAGVARAEQLAAQPTTDGLDRVGADDRPRPGHARRGPRGRHRLDVPERRGRPLEERRLRGHGPEQLLAAPGERRGRRLQGARRGRGRQRPGRPGHGLRRRLQRDRRRSPDGPDLLDRLEGGLGRGARNSRRRTAPS